MHHSIFLANNMYLYIGRLIVEILRYRIPGSDNIFSLVFYTFCKDLEQSRMKKDEADIVKIMKTHDAMIQLFDRDNKYLVNISS